MTDSTEAVGVVPGTAGEDSTDSTDPDAPDGGSSLAWLWLIAGAAAVGWWLQRRRGNRPAEPTLGGTSDDGGVFVEPTAPPPEARGPDLFLAHPKVGTHGSAAREGEVIPKLEIGPEVTETKGKGKKKGNIEYGWKVEEGEAGAVPKLEVDAGGDAGGHVFPKVEMHGTATEPGEVIPKLEIDPGATEAKGEGLIAHELTHAADPETGRVFPKLEIDAAGGAEGKVIPKIEVPDPLPLEGEVIPKLEIDPGATEAKGGGNAETTWKVEKGEAAAPGPLPEPDGDILDQLDDEG